MDTTSYGRRRFLTLLGAASAAGALLAVDGLPAAAGARATTSGGRDLTGWETVVGDGVYALPGEAPVTLDDIAVENRGNRSRLRANVRRRGIAAHVLAFNRIIDPAVLTVRHTASYRFRLPYLPSTSGSELNGQTLEGGLFVWDGADTRYDYGTAFQWVLNPWVPEFGDINIWTSDNGGSWAYGGHLEPDTGWHTARFVVDPVRRVAVLALDRTELAVPFSRTPKDGWGTEVAARLQAEAVSIWPNAANATTPEHRVLVKDWAWSRR